MIVDTATLLAIFGMALATYATRLAGLLLVRHLAVGGRLGGALEALGPAETIAALITVLAATRLPMLATIAIGVGAAVLLRQVI
jgi:uncharacterized membrane protein